MLKQLPAAECLDIVKSSLKELRSNQDIASEHHTCPLLVGRLVKNFKDTNSLITKKRHEEDQTEEISRTLEEVVRYQLANGRHIWSSTIIQGILK
jgi:hypothetical protein